MSSIARKQRRAMRRALSNVDKSSKAADEWRQEE